MYTQSLEAKDTITTIRGKKTHILDVTTGYALCGAGQPNWQFPLGSAIPNQGTEKVNITCYKCKKLSYINSFPESENVPTRDFKPSQYVGNTVNFDKVKFWAISNNQMQNNKKYFRSQEVFDFYLRKKDKGLLNLLLNYESAIYGRRDQHVMIPFGNQGLTSKGKHGPLTEKKEATDRGIKLFSQIYENWEKRKNKSIDADIEDIFLETEGKIDIKESADEFYLSLDANDVNSEKALRLWNKYSPWKYSDKKSSRNPNVEVRTQTSGQNKYTSKHSQISKKIIDAQAVNTRNSQQAISKAAEVEIMKVRSAIDQLIENQQYSKVLTLSKRKDIVGRIALNSLLTDQAPEVLSYLSLDSVKSVVERIKLDRLRRAFRRWFKNQDLTLEELSMLTIITNTQSAFSNSLKELEKIENNTYRGTDKLKGNLTKLKEELDKFKETRKKKNPKILTNQVNLDSWNTKRMQSKRKVRKKNN